jgi:hypothetical protein
MTFNHGLGMLLFSMVVLIVGALIAFYIINKVVYSDKKK